MHESTVALTLDNYEPMYYSWSFLDWYLLNDNILSTKITYIFNIFHYVLTKRDSDSDNKLLSTDRVVVAVKLWTIGGEVLLHFNSFLSKTSILTSTELSEFVLIGDFTQYIRHMKIAPTIGGIPAEIKATV